MIKARTLALLAVLFWSTAASAFKITLRYLTPFQLVLAASAVSTLILWTIVLITRRRVIHDLWGASLRGLLNPAIYYMVLLHAYNGLPAQVAMVINYTWPISLLLLSFPVLGQRLNARGLGASVICLFGVILLALGGDPSGGGLSALSMGLALLSTVIWALYWLLNMRAEGDPAANLASSFSFGLLYLLVFGLVFNEGFIPDPIRIQGLLGAVYVGIFEMGLTFVIWLKALERAATTAEVGNMIYFTPFLALVFIGTAVGEVIGPWTIAGLLLVILGTRLTPGKTGTEAL